MAVVPEERHAWFALLLMKGPTVACYGGSVLNDLTIWDPGLLGVNVTCKAHVADLKALKPAPPGSTVSATDYSSHDSDSLSAGGRARQEDIVRAHDSGFRQAAGQ